MRSSKASHDTNLLWGSTQLRKTSWVLMYDRIPESDKFRPTALIWLAGVAIEIGSCRIFKGAHELYWISTNLVDLDPAFGFFFCLYHLMVTWVLITSNRFAITKPTLMEERGLRCAAPKLSSEKTANRSLALLSWEGATSLWRVVGLGCIMRVKATSLQGSSLRLPRIGKVWFLIIHLAYRHRLTSSFLAWSTSAK